MNDTLLQLYHRLPASLRSVPASLYGFYLRYWRYSVETERLVAEALEREQWSPERWKAWQEERLAYVLHRAATRVPYYREQWAARRRLGDRSSWEYLEHWPILEKEPLRKNPSAFVADDCPKWYLCHEHTSGTSGKPLDLWQSRKTMLAWYSLFEARCRNWNGISRHDRWAILGGQLVVPVSQRRSPFWVWNAALNQLYLSSYHLSFELIPEYLDAFKCYKIKYILAYTSSIYAIAQEVLEMGREDLQMLVVITNAEPVFDYQRATISEAFRCPVRETYGMAELVAAASECHAGQLHLWPEVGWVEVLESGQPVDAGIAGDLVCTGLLNPDMLLIRYRVGDRGVLSTAKLPCTCGRTLPLLTAVEGRSDDMLYTADGRYIGRLDPVFKAHLPVREAQIIQESLGRLCVRYVPAPNFTPEASRSIVQRLQQRMGNVEVLLEQVHEIPREKNGKFRAVICNLPREQVAALRHHNSKTAIHS
jgi:phenylacetate-CoA ligase